MSRKTRVLLADDHAVVRAGLRAIINSEADMEVVGEAGGGQEGGERTRGLLPDVVGLDLSMPGGGGMRALPRITEASAATRVVVLTMHDDPAYVRSVLAAGGWGYVLKHSADVDVVRAVRSVQHGRRFVDATLAASVLDDITPQEKPPQLSRRELTVLRYIAQGHSYQAIAEKLCLSVKTVESYRARIAQKLGFRKRSEIVRYALMTGLLTAEDSHQTDL